MAGVKGRSGGPRKNSGGKRQGAGRKPKPAPKKSARRKAKPALSTQEEAVIGARLPNAPGFVPPAPPPPPVTDAEPATAASLALTDAKAFLEGVIAGRLLATGDQIRAAQALLPFQHKKLGETGKKESLKDEAGKVAGRFSPAPPPRLASVAGKRV